MTDLELMNWWATLDVSWKKIFLRRLDLSIEPSLLQLRQLLSSKELYCVLETEIKDLRPIEKFIHLKKIELMGAKNIQSISPLINNSELKYLNLAETKVENIEALDKFPKLEELYLPDNAVNIDSLRNLKNLKRLYFRTSKTIKSLEPLTNLIELEEIAISDDVKSLRPIDHLLKIKRLVGFGISKKEENRFHALHPDIEFQCGTKAEMEMEQILSELEKLKVKEN